MPELSVLVIDFMDSETMNTRLPSGLNASKHKRAGFQNDDVGVCVEGCGSDRTDIIEKKTPQLR